MSSFVSKIAKHARDKGSKVAIIDKNGRWTY
jgi:hypothetical protein